MTNVVGREAEIKILDVLHQAKEAQFLVLYGRRRVGKTYLIREYFKDKGLFFELTGIKKGTMQDQLESFSEVFSSVFYEGIKLNRPRNWRDAFSLLTNTLKNVESNKKIILFFDELPWLVTKRSKFIPMLDYFWNTQWSKMPNIRLVVCGSAASWMLDKIVNDKGGLHNRLTQTLLLEPFDLEQTQEFLNTRGIKFNTKQLLDIYMVMGGIPYYLKAIKRGQSASQIINGLCFDKNGLLLKEFDKLFQSLFEDSDIHIAIVRAISKKRYGLSRNELLKALKLKSGGEINKKLNELIAAGFVQRFIPFGKKLKDHYYRVIDEYTLFYLYWIEPYKKDPRSLLQSGYWQKISRTPKANSWFGYAFEEICYKHIHRIAKGLSLESVLWYVSDWRKIDKEEGAQIDLLFDRDDGVITLCEIKYSSKPFIIDREYAGKLIKKIDVFKKTTKTKKQLQLAMITTHGVHPNVWSEELLDAEVCLDDFFKYSYL